MLSASSSFGLVVLQGCCELRSMSCAVLSCYLRKSVASERDIFNIVEGHQANTESKGYIHLKY